MEGEGTRREGQGIKKKKEKTRQGKRETRCYVIKRKTVTEGVTSITEITGGGGRVEGRERGRGHTHTTHTAHSDNSCSAQKTESEKIGGGARILKYERSRRARPPSAAGPIGRAKPDCSSSSHLAVSDWL